MSLQRVYFDYNATAPLLDAARTAMVNGLTLSGNPSSVHDEGRKARRVIDSARHQVAALCNGDPAHVVFTSGASEAASMLLVPQWRMGRKPLRIGRLVVLASDHPCILCGGHFPADEIIIAGVDDQGRARLDEIESALALDDSQDGLVMVAFHAANNETGVMQDVEAIASMAKRAGAIVVVDAVQAVGRVRIDITNGSVDFLILSSHKMGGPKGAGAIVGKGDLMMPAPLIRGGGQEKGHRAGTENVAAIAGFGAAAEAAIDGLKDAGRLAGLREDIERVIAEAAPDTRFFGSGTERLCNTSLFALPGMKAETAQIAFDLAGISLSAGSACSSGKVGPSHVLKAMGHGDEASALRLSIGTGTSVDEVSRFKVALEQILSRQRSASQAA